MKLCEYDLCQEILTRKEKESLRDFKKRRFCGYVCRNKARLDPEKTKYQTVKVDGKTQRLHRVILEEHLGRKLENDEITHHVDGDTHNNDPENLVAMRAGEHSRLHNSKYPVYRNCANCGKSFHRKAGKRGGKNERKTCSEKCRRILQEQTKAKK